MAVFGVVVGCCCAVGVDLVMRGVVGGVGGLGGSFVCGCYGRWVDVVDVCCCAGLGMGNGKWSAEWIAGIGGCVSKGVGFFDEVGTGVIGLGGGLWREVFCEASCLDAAPCSVVGVDGCMGCGFFGELVCEIIGSCCYAAEWIGGSDAVASFIVLVGEGVKGGVGVVVVGF